MEGVKRERWRKRQKRKGRKDMVIAEEAREGKRVENQGRDGQ